MTDRATLCGAGTTRRLVLHVGQPKTGTSALQSWFARHRSDMRAAGVDYPEHPSDALAVKGKVTSGNGVGVHRLIVVDKGLANPDAVPAERDRFVDSIRTTTAQTTLYSTEAMWNIDPAKLERLRSALASEGIMLELVVFVRDVAPHALSLYGQAVKRHGYTQSFSEFIGRTGKQLLYGQNVGDRLKSWVDVLTASRIHVIHYDSHKSDVVRPVLATLGVNEYSTDVPDARVVVNRSLTSREIMYMRRFNRQVRDRNLWIRVSDQLVKLPPIGSPPRSISPDDADHLRATQHRHVDIVNRLFFESQPELDVLGSTPVITAEGPADELTESEEHLLSWFAHTLNTARG